MDTSEKETSFPVWVGSLAGSVNEPVLMAHFKKFGPIRSIRIVKDPVTGTSKQFGYVNYHNQEVAEVAAREMNNVEVCGKKIKTKGPQQLQSFSVENKTEVLNLTDCYFYTQFGKCEGNHGKPCQYRHFDELHKTKEICTSWANKSCTNLKCPKLHPSQRQFKENKNVPIVLERCKSHDTFKCCGQCDNADCDIHFLDERKLYDHIIEGKNLLSPCKICNAVFFSKEQKEKHSHTESSMKHVSTARSTVSDIAIHGGKNDEPIGFFWDIENCQVPKNKSALAIIQKLREKFNPGRTEAEFMCVCDTKKEKREVLEELNKGQINVVHINASSKNTADDKLRQALRRFAQSNPPPATILLVSGDINFATELSDLRYRQKFHVILVHNRQTSEALLHFANECVQFDDFTSSISPSTSLKATDTNMLAVFNLPNCKTISVERISNRLKMLTNNTSGKVIKVRAFGNPNENKAIIQFPDPECAQRALQRINGQDVFGHTIRASFHYKKNKEHKVPRSSVNREFSQPSGVYTNLKKFGSSSVPNLNRAQENSRRKKKSFNKEDFVQNENIAHNHSSVKFMAPNLLKNEAQTGINSLQSLIPPLMGVFPYRIPPPSINNGNQLLPNNFLPSNNLENNNTVTILVSNLNKSVSLNELKAGLNVLFRKHSKVLDIRFHQKKDNTQHALVKVTSLQDAHLCILKLNNSLLFNHSIKLSLTPNEDDALIKMKERVKSILLDTFSGWLPLNEFLSKFKVKYSEAFHVINFELMKDLIYIDGKPGYQFICLLPFPVGFLKLKCNFDLQEKLAGVLKDHNRKVPLASLPGLYWSHLQQVLPLSQDGVPFLSHVLNKNIVLVGEAPGSQAVFYKKLPPKNGYPLSSFQSDIILLLKMSSKFTIPCSRFVSLYHQFFGRELRAQDYKCKDVTELLNAVSNIVEFGNQNRDRVLTFTKDYKMHLLNEEFVQLLMSREKQKLPISSLLTSYYRFFGHKLCFSNFGFNTLQLLLSSLNKKIKVFGAGERQILAMVQTEMKSSSQSVEEFAKEVIAIIEGLPEKQIGMHNLSSEYHKKYGRQLKLNKLGFSKLSDLVDAISGLIKVEGVGNQKTLSLLANGDIEHNNLWQEIIQVVKSMPHRAIMVLHLSSYYQEVIRKPFPLENWKTNPFFDEAPSRILNIGIGANRILIDVDKENYPQRLLVLWLLNVTYSCENFTSNCFELSQILKNVGINVKPEQILAEISNHRSFKVKESNITLEQSAACKLFEHDILSLLYEEQSYLQLDGIINKYQTKFSRLFRISDFGFDSVQALCENLTQGIVVVTPAENSVKLGPLGKIYFKCKDVINSHHGALMLCNFASEFHKKHNIKLKLEDYGFSKIIDLITCFSGIFFVHDEKNMKLIISNDYLNIPNGLGKAVRNNPQRALELVDVIIESEDSDEVEKDDLLVFDDEDDKPNVLSDLIEEELTNPLEWWMDPPPNLSEPVLEPELSQSQVVYDLISFTEFEQNQDIVSGGLNKYAADSVSITESAPYSLQTSLLSKDTILDAYNFDQKEIFSEESILLSDVLSQDSTQIPDSLVGRQTFDFRTSDLYDCFSDITVSSQWQKSQSSNRVDTPDKISARPKLAANFSKQ